MASKNGAKLLAEWQKRLCLQDWTMQGRLLTQSGQEVNTMDDLIRRQAAIDELDKGAWGVEWDKTLAKTMIESLPPAQQWIPVSERLPEHEKARYWVCTDTGHQCECRWTDNRFGMCNLSGEWGWSIFDTPPYSEVIAWMPLPEPYKEDE